MKVIGFKDTTYDFKKENKQVIGKTLYLAEERKTVTGFHCESVFVSEGKLDGYKPALDDEIEVYYNRFGKVQSVKKVS